MAKTTKAAWVPSEKILQNSRLGSWMQKLGFSDYDSFYQKTVKEIDWFWYEAVKELDIEWFSNPNTTLDLSKGMMYPDWFVGGRLNTAYNAVEKWAGIPSSRHRTALIWEGDNQEKKAYTYEQLNAAANAAANGFKQLGVKRGDIIFLYMPMIPETVIAMLAISKIGAVFTPAFSGYKADALSTRLQASEAKFVVTADGYYRRGKIVNMKQEADKAANQLNSVEKMIVVERIGGLETLQSGRDISWDTLVRDNSDFKAVEADSDEPFMIIYTSGTTGKPKGTVHTHAGFPIKAAFDAGICMDVRPEDTLFWLTDMGWMMGPFLVYGGLMNGAAIVLFEGTPDYPGPDRLWQLTEEHQITHLGISPTLIRSLMQYGTKPLESYVLSSLRLFASTGEPWNEKPWVWLFEEIGKQKIPIFNYSGGTETSGGILGNVLVKPIQPANFNAALPGMAVNVFDQEGLPVTGEVGELVLQQPWVGMTKGFHKDNERYEATYWNRWENTWVHGDWVKKEANGYFTITGRSDDTLNIAGKRIGPTEIESCLVSHPAVAEAGVIGLPDKIKGETAAAFVVLQSVYQPTEQQKEELLFHLENRLGKALAPKQLYFLSDLPKTRNAKVMRRALKTAFLGDSPGDLSALVNPDILEEITSLRQK
ncbi:AMP-binding protein [Virgibacillus senegalensis]|uniref:AMP-binding protein n=1 Tax=Virgibacillus senegalensis TaxID=1499679 RepID=UPI00069EAC7A|nr:AMP-binding protein [Virgibacillus senegalensis]